MSAAPTVLVIMGVSGSGKSTLGRALAERLGWPFKEGDDLHPAANIAKMKAGIALNDLDRQPWLDAVGRWIADWAAAGVSGVITCSALKRAYRDTLRAAYPPTRFVFLRGGADMLQARLDERKGHFFPPRLLDSQLAALQAPGADEHPIVVDASQPIDAKIDVVVRALADESWGRRRRVMPRGYDRALYILPFDHRASFEKLFGWKPPLDPAQTAQIADAKQVIYEGFKAAVAGGVSRDRAAVLVDEQFGAAILRDASAAGFMTAAPVERSGQEVFDFEYGEDFARHVEAFRPTFCKVLVRYNPEGDPALNRVQGARLKRLSDYLAAKGASRFMLELLVPPETAQIDKVKGDKAAYDADLRPGLMVGAIEQLQALGVEPDIWKVEGLDRREDCQRIVSAARAGGRDRVSCIVLGRGENDRKVRQWLEVAASAPGFIGFAVGRTDFWNPLAALRSKKKTREQAIAVIARRYREFVDIFEQARGAAKVRRSA